MDDDKKETGDNIIKEENNNKDNIDHDEHLDQHNYKEEKENKFEKIKILFERYLLTFHGQLLTYLPMPYDYIFMFVFGYFFMLLFTSGKSNIYVKQKKKLTDMNEKEIENKLKEIYNIQKKIGEKNNNKQEKLNPIKNKLVIPKEIINVQKLEQIQNKLNVLMNDLCERNNSNSVEKTLQNNICDLEAKILEEVNKQTKSKEEEEEDEEEEEEKEGGNK